MQSAEILRAVGNKYSAEILEAADEPRSAQELSDDLGIPIATCYRRIDELTETGLLELHDDVTSEGQRRTKVYRRAVDEVRVGFRGSLTVSVEGRDTVTSKIDDIWEGTRGAAG